MAQREVSILLNARDNASAKFGAVGRASDSLKTKFTALRGGIGFLTGVLGFLGLTSAMRGALAGFGAQEKAEAKLAAVLRSTGGAAGFTAEQIKAFASELQGLTTFGDEVTINAAAMMATFTKLSGQVFKDAIAAAQNLSTVMGTDLNSAVVQVGKALQDPILGITALRRVGVNFDDQQKQLIKTLVESGQQLTAQKLILAELNVEFGGAAQAEADTMTGKITQMKNAWGDLAEVIVGQLSPGLKTAADLMKEILELLPTGGALPVTPGGATEAGIAERLGVSQAPAGQPRVGIGRRHPLEDALAKSVLQRKRLEEEQKTLEAGIKTQGLASLTATNFPARRRLAQVKLDIQAIKESEAITRQDIRKQVTTPGGAAGAAVAGRFGKPGEVKVQAGFDEKATAALRKAFLEPAKKRKDMEDALDMEEIRRKVLFEMRDRGSFTAEETPELKERERRERPSLAAVESRFLTRGREQSPELKLAQEAKTQQKLLLERSIRIQEKAVEVMEKIERKSTVVEFVEGLA